jgi:F-box protein 9
MEESNPELEQFRQQWRAEVSARSQVDANRASKQSKPSRKPPPITSLSSSNVFKSLKEEDEAEAQSFGLGRSSKDGENAESSSAARKEPQSALEHYEKAVERENQGILGDSLDLYRKAFRVSAVDLVCPTA